MSIDPDAYRALHDAGLLAGEGGPDSIADLTIRQETDPIRTVDEVRAALGRARPPERQRGPIPGFKFDDSAETEAWLESGRYR
jgi:hypothetical protein